MQTRHGVFDYVILGVSMKRQLSVEDIFYTLGLLVSVDATDH